MRKSSSKGASDIKAPKPDPKPAGQLPSSNRELLKQVRKIAETLLPPAPMPITLADSNTWQQAFEHFNTALFGGQLPNVSFHYESRAHSGGHFAPDRFTYRSSGEREHHIALNPDGFNGRTDEWIVSILVHEMAHLWQHTFGTRKRARYSYHDKEWAAKMIEIGLMPSSTGKPGGKQTGQRMSDYVIEGGAYQQAFTALAATGWKLPLESTVRRGDDKKKANSKLKYTCPGCGSNMWGKPDSKDVCPECNQWRVPEAIADDADVASYDVVNEAAE